MAEKFKSLYIDHIPHQQNAHALASLATSLALSAGATEKVLVQSYDLYCLKFAFEDWNIQVKEVLETSTGSESRDW